MVKKLIMEDIYFMSEEEVRSKYPEYVGICYANDNYRNDVRALLDLKEEILKDYPNMSISNMNIWILRPEEARRNVGRMAIYVVIPVEDYLTLRREHMVTIR